MVGESALVNVLETIADATGDDKALLQVPRAVVEVPFQVRAVNIFEDKALAVVPLQEFIDLGHVLVRKLLELLDTADEVAKMKAIPEKGAVEQLQSDDISIVGVDAAVHYTGAALSKDAVQFEAI